MPNKEFLEICELRECREKVARFADKHSRLNGYDESRKRALEEDLIELICSVRAPVYRAVDREFHRSDVQMMIREWFGENAECVLRAVPMRVVDNIINAWQNALEDCDRYWEDNWDMLRNVCDGIAWLTDFETYDQTQISLYAAYLQTWYATHGKEEPIGIAEFVNNELQTDERKRYYQELLQKMKRREE